VNLHETSYRNGFRLIFGTAVCQFSTAVPIQHSCVPIQHSCANSAQLCANSAQLCQFPAHFSFYKTYLLLSKHAANNPCNCSQSSLKVSVTILKIIIKTQQSISLAKELLKQPNSTAIYDSDSFKQKYRYSETRQHLQIFWSLELSTLK
jgi:hypothetical protein